MSGGQIVGPPSVHVDRARAFHNASLLHEVQNFLARLVARLRFSEELRAAEGKKLVASLQGRGEGQRWNK